MRRTWRAVLSLGACAAIATFALSWIADGTSERITVNQRAWEARILADVLPADGFDNQPWEDMIGVESSALLGSAEIMPVYRARRGEQIAGTVITIVAPDGYVGPIRLLVGIAPDHSVIAVRAVEHRETPGLGDGIDAGRSGWIEAFAGFSEPADASAWNLRPDGGRFDSLTGATVTSRAVINAVRNASEFHRQHFDVLHESPAGSILRRLE
jgi:electron transport complex protein RnfG